MSPEALDLLEKMLCLDPTRRITARTALSHSFVNLDPTTVPPIVMPSQGLLNNITSHSKCIIFIKAWLMTSVYVYWWNYYGRLSWDVCEESAQGTTAARASDQCSRCTYCTSCIGCTHSHKSSTSATHGAFNIILFVSLFRDLYRTNSRHQYLRRLCCTMLPM